VLTHAVSNDPLVIEQAKSAWIVIIVLFPFAILIGIFENFVIAKQMFKYLFGSMVVAVVVGYLPILLAAEFYFKSLIACWMAVLSLDIFRLAPAFGMSMYFLSAKPKPPKKVEPVNDEQDEETTRLLVNTADNDAFEGQSINGDLNAPVNGNSASPPLSLASSSTDVDEDSKLE